MNSQKKDAAGYTDIELLTMVRDNLQGMGRPWEGTTVGHTNVWCKGAYIKNDRLMCLVKTETHGISDCDRDWEPVQLLCVVWGDDEWLPLNLNAYDLKQEMIIKFTIPEFTDNEEPTMSDFIQ